MSFSGENLVLIYAMLKSAVIFRN